MGHKAIPNHTLQRLFSMALIFASACSSLGEKSGPVFKDSELGRNAYYGFYATASEGFQRKLRKTPFHLFRGSFEVFLSRLAEPKRPVEILQGIGSTLAFGDFHPQQMTLSGNEARLDDFDTVARGPWWIDLVRMEAGALVVAQMQSLKSYKSGSCIDAYTRALATQKIQGSPIAMDRGTEKFVEHASDLADWKEAKGTVPEDLKEAFKKQIESEGKTHVLDMRAYQGGVGSFLTTKYLALLANDSILELKVEDEQPLFALGAIGASKTPAPPTCARFVNGAKAYAPKVDWNCWNFGNKSYARIPWSLKYIAPEAADFKSEKLLSDHLAWMCSSLATVHAPHFDGNDLKSLTIALERNPLFRERLRNLAIEESDGVLRAHRMILEQAGKN